MREREISERRGKGEAKERERREVNERKGY